MSIAPERTGIGIHRHFTTPGVHPYDEIVWERRDARISNFRDGSVAFEQIGVEFPVGWSLNATNIVAQKYFRGTLGTQERETSLRQVVDRVADTISQWGIEGGYFVDAAEAEAFRNELKYVLVTQRAAFNSPVWFNIGVKGVPQQASACFILSVDDTMDSILNWYAEEGVIFKGGSGAGVNLSRIRSSEELLKGGGTASGPVSFMRGADASAGTIKSGGKTRRAAKMVILNVDHPDVEEFIWCKTKEERKARVLRDAGFDMDLDGSDSFSIQYQNANNSVRVTDEFMTAVERDEDWHLRAVITGEIIRTVRARDLFRQIAQAAWDCADPGMQFDTTINNWHTAAATGRINGSNPCFTGDSMVHTDKGLIAFRELLTRANAGEQFGIYTHDVTNVDAPAQQVLVSSPEAFMITGTNPIVRLRLSNGAELRCTPGHKIFTTNRGYVPASELTANDAIRTLDLPTPAVNADLAIPVECDPAAYATSGDHRRELRLPEVWDEEFAHYLGWLIGDGSTSGSTTSSIYGSPQDRTEILPRHQDLLEWINGDRSLKPSEQRNGTVQLRIARRGFKRFLEALGVRSVTGGFKTVPWSLEQAPTFAQAAFLRGLFDADGCAVVNPAKGSYVGLGSISHELLQGVQRMVSTFGITSRIYSTKSAGASSFTYTRTDGTEVAYKRSASYDLRITSGSLNRFAAEIGFTLSAKAERLAEIVATREVYDVDTTAHLVERSDDGVELTYNLSEPRNHSYIVNGVVVRNCSEYMHLDNSACNLASINLLKYLGEDDRFDIDAFRHTVEVMFTAQEILVGRADYPTPPIAETSRQFRQLGIGYANLGALLMALGLPYDSDQGRAIAAAITSLMTGHSYATSAKTAGRMGPFTGFSENESHMLKVLRMHRDAAADLDDSLVDAELLAAARQSWDEAVAGGEEFGVRNSQASVLAPTGTIGLMMDCDTTGIEPDLGLVKFKKLVGGGNMAIVNQTVPRALRRLGYSASQIDEIVAYIDVNKSIVGAPHLAADHLPVFACSMGDNTIHYLGHVRMMGAVQPFISGAISKTVNMPEEATVEEIEALHLESWKLGLKAVAIYRDNCKVAQPLSTAKKDGPGIDSGAAGTEGAASDAAGTGAGGVGSAGPQVVERIVERIVERVVHAPVREKLARSRRSQTFEFRVADCKGFVTVGEYADGRPGELFIRVSKQGSTLAGIMDAFAISVSHGLQYGVPLRAFVAAYTNMRFEPAGMTDDPDIRFASSIMDYLFRRLALEYMTYDERAELAILSIDERMEPTLPGIEESVIVTMQGHDVVSDPKSIPSASELSAQLDAGLLAPAPSQGEFAAPSGGGASVTRSSAQPAAASGSAAITKSSTPGRIAKSAVPGAPKLISRPNADAPMCMQCGVQMVRAGSCHACPSCGSTSGCS
jgi:ribonucleoside-diphosphate reductase alpha chain